MKKRVVLLLLAAILISSTACNDVSTDVVEETTKVTETESATVPAEEYTFPTLDLQGKDFIILNTQQPYLFYSVLDFDTMPSEPVDDAVYNRNRQLEEQFQFKYHVIEDYSLKDAAKALQTSVISGDDNYDVAFIRDSYMGSLIRDNSVADLQDYDEFQFNKSWWDSESIEATRIGQNKEINYAYTNTSLVDFEGTICCFFNDNLLANYGLEAPFTLVRNGEWTLDEFEKYIRAGANLNGDDEYVYVAGGSCTFGATSWQQGEVALVIGSGGDLFARHDTGEVTIEADSEHFINAAQKVISLLINQGEYIRHNQSGEDNQEKVFKEGRSLIVIAQIKSTTKFRDMDDSYSIIPMPKFDIEQQNYRHLRSYSFVMCVPSISQSIEQTGIIMDAMSYLSNKDVMPEFYNTRLSYKGLRNEESIEMLNIISNSRCIDIGFTYGWSTSLRTVITDAVEDGSITIVSAIESVKRSVEESITATIADIDK